MEPHQHQQRLILASRTRPSHYSKGFPISTKCVLFCFVFYKSWVLILCPEAASLKDRTVPCSPSVSRILRTSSPHLRLEIFFFVYLDLERCPAAEQGKVGPGKHAGFRPAVEGFRGLEHLADIRNPGQCFSLQS